VYVVTVPVIVNAPVMLPHEPVPVGFNAALLPGWPVLTVAVSVTLVFCPYTTLFGFTEASIRLAYNALTTIAEDTEPP